MNFLAPLFLAGALAIAVPVIFHLIRRTTRQRTPFSSLMFLRPRPPRLTRRNRLEHILLLCLRCLAICLLAMGFARPVVKRVLPERPSADPPKRIVILLDSSASMRRANLWAQAREKVEAVLQKTSPGDRVALFTFDVQLTPVVTFDEWQSTAASDRAALVRARLAGAGPGWAGTRLDQAIVRASELLSQPGEDFNSLRRIVLVSDFQEGSKLGALQGQEWPKGVELVSERVVVKSSNAGLQLLADANATSGSAGKIRLRVSNEADSARDRFEVGWVRREGGFITNATEVYVPAGQSRIAVLPSLEKSSGADRIVLRGDDEGFDNAVYHLPIPSTRVKVIYFGSESATNSREPLYFVMRALQGTSQRSIEIVPKPSGSAPEEAADATLFIVSETLSEPMATMLRSQAMRGRTVLFTPRTAEAASMLGFLLGHGRMAAEEIVPAGYAMLGEMDFRHPLFSPFADARYSDFSKIHFWRYRRLASLNPEARIVAKFDNGDPAILDCPVGKGRIVVFASGWHPADSQLALSTKFVPLLCSALELEGNASGGQSQFHVADMIPLPGDWVQAAGATTVTLPDGSSVKLAPGETNFTQATMPGVYRVTAGTSEKQFAVNLDAMESRTSPLPLDELERLGVPTRSAAVRISVDAPSRHAVMQSAEMESRQKLWRWLVGATLCVLLLEAAVAGWTARKSPPGAEAAI